MTRAETMAYNAGVADLSAIAQAAADALRAKITEAPTRYNFAIGALDGIVEAAHELMLPTASNPPQSSEDAGCKEAIDGC